MSSKGKGRVVVAMSGGVDSSTAAYLLKKEGHDVVGMSMQVWDHTKGESECDTFGSCCSPEDVYDARCAAESLRIPFYVINLEEPFRKEVINRFADEYLKGRTPNPCIICNERLKFHYLLKKASEIEADYIATGHYARIENLGGTYFLFKGVDTAKDQSYFLFSLTQDKLSSILMPLGSLTKAKVREIAKGAGLKVARKKESQEICFVNENGHGTFIETHYRDNIGLGGNFVDLAGNILGRHKGIHHYTVGQRRGLGIPYKEPLYVLRIDLKNNTVVVGRDKELYKAELKVRDFSWISGRAPSSGVVKAKIRYKTPEARARFEFLSEGGMKIIFDEPQRGPTPGQACVFYSGDEVLGGGWIV